MSTEKPPLWVNSGSDGIAAALAHYREAVPIAEEVAAVAVPDYEYCKRCKREGVSYSVRIATRTIRVELRGRMTPIRVAVCRPWCLACDGRPPLDRVESDPQREEDQ